MPMKQLEMWNVKCFGVKHRIWTRLVECNDGRWAVDGEISKQVQADYEYMFNY